MGIFKGINKSSVYGRGKYIKSGFRGVLQVKKTIAKPTRASGMCFIVEYEVVETNLPDDHAVGSKCTWLQKMSDLDIAFPAIIGWMAAIGGYDSSDTDKINEEVAPEAEDELEKAVASPADNAFTDSLLRLETFTKETRAGNDFTVHVWEPHDAAA